MLYNLEPDKINKYFTKKGLVCTPRTSYKTEYTVYLRDVSNCSMIIQELHSNCSTVFLTSVYANAGTQSIKKLLKALAHWAYYAGYTKFFFSANGLTNYYGHTEFINIGGFEKVGNTYKSRRTENQISWYQADIINVRKLLRNFR